MRLICEQLEDVEFICEGAGKTKNYFIEGVFQKNDESDNPDFKQSADEIAIMINYRIPMNVYLW